MAQSAVSFPTVLALIASAAAITAALIMMLRPLLVRYAMARPNARSSHHEPTPQGGGIAVMAAVLAVTAAAVLITSPPVPDDLLMVFGAAVLLATVGAHLIVAYPAGLNAPIPPIEKLLGAHMTQRNWRVFASLAEKAAALAED